MTRSPTFVALDLGAESGRAMAGELDSKRLKLEEVHRFANGGVRAGDTLYWDALRLYRNTVEGMQRAADKYGDSLQSVAIDTWGVDFGLLSASDQLVGNPYHYRDAHTNGILEHAYSLVPREEIYKRTGNQLMQINTIFQLLAMARRNAFELEVGKQLLNMPDLLNFWYTGRKASEFSIATTTQAYNQLEGRWDRSLLEAFGISPDLFGEVVQPGTVLGELRPELAAETSSTKLKVIAVGSHDTASAIAAVPTETPEYVFISSGTWSLIGTELPRPIVNELTMAANLTNEGGVGSSSVQRISAGMWLLQECRRIWALAGREYSYAELAELANQAADFTSVIVPGDERFLAPSNMPGAISGFCKETGQPVPGEVSEYVRCILRSLALEYRWVVEQLEKVAERSLPAIYIIGGGSRNELLNQMTANATGRPVRAGPVEATAIGSILVQAQALGYLDSLEQGRELVRHSFPIAEYVPQDSSAWDAAYSEYSKLRAASNV